MGNMDSKLSIPKQAEELDAMMTMLSFVELHLKENYGSKPAKVLEATRNILIEQCREQHAVAVRN